jgi:glutamyl-tRNA synthetase
VGHARTFWTAWQRARDAGGALIMRMEDLDPERSKSAFAEAAYEDLRWLGIRWLEGPDKGGPYAPYVQSRRRSIYLAAWRRLLRRGYIYPCRCSRKDLETALGAPHERTLATAQGSVSAGKWDLQDDEPIYPGTCRRLLAAAPQLPGSTVSDIDSPDGFNWRFRVPDGEAIEFDDRNLGPQRFVAGVDFGDFVVWRRDGVPSYQLACVADDAAMGITEVVRGPAEVERAADSAQPRAGLCEPSLVPLPPGGGSQRPPPGQAPRLTQPARPAPARPYAHEHPLGRAAGGGVRPRGFQAYP